MLVFFYQNGGYKDAIIGTDYLSFIFNMCPIFFTQANVSVNFFTWKYRRLLCNFRDSLPLRK